MSSLAVENVSAAYGSATVLAGVSVEATPGQITCILGANGAGKTTLIRAILGLLPLKRGRILLDGADISALPTHARIGRGLACVPEGRRVFPKMTVEENLRAGAFLAPDEAVTGRRLARVYEIFPRLLERRQQLAGTMSGGEQAMVSIGRALMAEPKVILIDEPSLGLSPALVKESFAVIRRINEAKVTVLLIEQNVHQTLAIAHRGYVLAQGRIVAQGEPDSLRSDPEVERAYFGKSAGSPAGATP